MDKKPIVNSEEHKIKVTGNLVQFFELLLKVDARLQEQKRKEALS